MYYPYIVILLYINVAYCSRFFIWWSIFFITSHRIFVVESGFFIASHFFHDFPSKTFGENTILCILKYNSIAMTYNKNTIETTITMTTCNKC